MGQMAEGWIMVNGSQGVGRVRVDPGRVRGEGGPLDSRLVVPVTVEMNSRPKEEMLALLRLSGALHLSDPENPASRIGLVDSHDLVNNIACRSIPSGNTTTQVDFRFPLTLPLVERLESARHAAPEEEFVAHVHLDGVVAWVHRTHGEAPMPGEAIKNDTQPSGLWGLGLHSEVSLFWIVKIDPLRLAIDTSSWIRNVLPGPLATIESASSRSTSRRRCLRLGTLRANSTPRGRP